MSLFSEREVIWSGLLVATVMCAGVMGAGGSHQWWLPPAIYGACGALTWLVSLLRD